MDEKFVPIGAVVVVVGTVQNDSGQILRTSLAIQLDGECEQKQYTREGLLQIQSLLLEAVAKIGQGMINTPNIAESQSKIVIASTIPKMPEGFKM